LFLPLPCDPIDCTTDAVISNDLMLPSNPPVTIVFASDNDDDEPTTGAANDKSGPDSMLCVSINGELLAAVSCIRTAPSQLVEANNFLLSLLLDDDDGDGRYRSFDIPSGNLSNNLASGGGCVVAIL